MTKKFSKKMTLPTSNVCISLMSVFQFDTENLAILLAEQGRLVLVHTIVLMWGPSSEGVLSSEWTERWVMER